MPDVETGGGGRLFFKPSSRETPSQDVPFAEDGVCSNFKLTQEFIEEAEKIIKEDEASISSYWKDKSEKEAMKNWDKFYLRNERNFFKDRNWITREFDELNTSAGDVNTKRDEEEFSFSSFIPEEEGITKIQVLDVGCGVGNTIFPLLQENPKVSAICIDGSAVAIQLLQLRWEEIQKGYQKEPSSAHTVCVEESLHQSEESLAEASPASSCISAYQRSTRTHQPFPVQPIGKLLKAATVDLVKEEVCPTVCAKGWADFVLLFYCLSAIHPKHHAEIAKRCALALKPGGALLFRDYGRFDMAQVRFASSHKSKLEENFYVRYDGTFSYFFSQEDLERAFCEAAGLEEESNYYILREITNRKTNQRMKRVWIQGRFRKPLKAEGSKAP